MLSKFKTVLLGVVATATIAGGTATLVPAETASANPLCYNLHNSKKSKGNIINSGRVIKPGQSSGCVKDRYFRTDCGKAAYFEYNGKYFFGCNYKKLSPLNSGVKVVVKKIK